MSATVLYMSISADGLMTGPKATSTSMPSARSGSVNDHTHDA
jgi:hypothetical protein